MEGVLNAVNKILESRDGFWDDFSRNLSQDLDLFELLEDVSNGQYICYNPYIKGNEKCSR